MRLQEEKEKKTTLKQSCNITDDSPPTIELIAYKCSDAGGDGSGDVAGEGSGGSGGGRGSYDETGEGYQISGYEADDDTLNSREMKLFKPSKFVPKLASSTSVWKPSTTTTTTIGDAKLSWALSEKFTLSPSSFGEQANAIKVLERLLGWI